MRSIWTGSIAFGLVNIPVKLFSAIQERAIDFDMLDKKDLSSIHFKRINANTGKEVAWNNIVKGYNLKGKYVILSDKDFENASPEKTKTIDLQMFVKVSDVDIILFDSAYYLSPAKGGERAFGLLEEALNKSGMAGVGSFVMRNKEHPILLRSAKGILVLHTLHFLNEIRNPASFSIEIPPTKKDEIAMASNLIKNMQGDFNISDFKDNYTLKLMKMIKAKSSGKKLPIPKVTNDNRPANDLIEQLKLSLERPIRAKRKSK